MTSLPIFRRAKPTELQEAQRSAERAQNVLSFLEGQRERVDSLVKVLGDRSTLNNFGDEVTISFTPRRFPDAYTRPRPRDR